MSGLTKEEIAEAAVKRALEIVNAVEWSGDMRVNMTTIIGAGRVLAKHNAELQAEVERLHRVLKRLAENPPLSSGDMGSVIEWYIEEERKSA